MAGAIKNLGAGTLALRRWAYNSSRFNRYGLYRDDILFEDDDVKEALKRVPEHVVDERNFRLIRAMQLSLQKIYLPKDQWVKFEEDVPYLYPIVKQVIKEREEREEWEKNH